MKEKTEEIYWDEINSIIFVIIIIFITSLPFWIQQLEDEMSSQIVLLEEGRL